MAFAPPKNTNGPKMQTKMSTWTPLNHQIMNDQVFEERTTLLGKWFDKWTDAQRRRILTDLLERCSMSQLKFCSHQLQKKVPSEALDFTTVLPRVLSLYIFSFLDPRSLCRCAQTPPKDDFVVIDVQPIGRDVPEMKPSLSSLLLSVSMARKMMGKEKRELPPWRSSDKHPTDTMRFNYLDNLDPIEQARQAKKKGGGITPDYSQGERKKRPSSASYKLRKAKSLMSLSADLSSQPKTHIRPNWATPHSAGYPVTKATAKTLAQSTEWNAGIRPAPVQAPIPKMSERGKKACKRTARSSPSSPLFESQPWQVSLSNRGSDEE
ncbi:F-box only protein 16 isoform X2 [Rhinatrema bivittatum]|uniref:F-box only protein 16 isoform X2 n=1 Tax=Rhinatrema bivittatum TaxID=194408 RepID=UPI00112BF2F9|nr:F-box only protein 16 isoform X2 [Rhinatrema bivittatum]